MVLLKLQLKLSLELLLLFLDVVDIVRLVVVNDNVCEIYKPLFYVFNDAPAIVLEFLAVKVYTKIGQNWS